MLSRSSNEKTGCPVRVLNDGDAAGLAEMELGAGKHRKDVVIMLTFGTGIGTAIFVEGHLLPNTELGHLPVRGKDAEHRAASRIRDDEDLSWKQWAERVNEYLELLKFFFSPDLFIIGGGREQETAQIPAFFGRERRNRARPVTQ